MDKKKGGKQEKEIFIYASTAQMWAFGGKLKYGILLKSILHPR